MQANAAVVLRARRIPRQRVLAALPHAQARMAIRRAVGHGAVRNTRRILDARPVRTTGRADVVLVQRPQAVPTGRGIVVPVPLDVGMSAEQQHMRKILQQREQPFTVRGTEATRARFE